MSVHIGPAGWSYEDWKGKVYPDPPPRGFDELPFMAQFFTCIELNNTFYRPPTARMSQAWASKTPDGFLFTAKLWEKFTHDKEGFGKAERELFQEGISPLLLAGKLGALLLQFPWFFKDEPAARDRIRKIVDLFGEWAPLVLEVRHTSWLGAFDFLREMKLAFCNIDQPKSSTSITGTSHVTGRIGYIRLHGRNAKAWFSKSADRDRKYDYLYSPEELAGWVDAARAMAPQVDRLFIIANNHFQGKAVVNALQLRRAIEGIDLNLPEPLRQSYPDVSLDLPGAPS